MIPFAISQKRAFVRASSQGRNHRRQNGDSPEHSKLEIFRLVFPPVADFTWELCRHVFNFVQRMIFDNVPRHRAGSDGQW